MNNSPTASKAGRTSKRGRVNEGRPSLYKQEFSERAEAMCAAGFTDAELAETLGICVSTLNLWKRKHPEFSESLKRGKAMADAQVARSLFQLAAGYSHPAEKVFHHQGKPLVVKYIRHYPPNVTACIFWLKNRQPGHWRDVHPVELVGSSAAQIEQRSVEELQAELMRLGVLDANGRFKLTSP